MGAGHSRASIRRLIDNLRRDLSAKEAELLIARNQLSSTRAELSSTLTNLRDSKEEIETLRKTNSDREAMIRKLIKVVELEEQVSSNKVEALSSKFNLEFSRKELEELQEQLLARKKFEDDMGMKLKKVMSIEKQVCSMNDEVLATKARLESSKKEENMLKEQLATQEKFEKEMEMKLQLVLKLEKEISQAKIEGLSSKCNLEATRKEEKMLKEQLLSHEKFGRDIEMKLQKVKGIEKQVLFIKAKDSFVKASLQASRKQEEGFKKQLLYIENQEHEFGSKFDNIMKLEKEISSSKAKVLSTMADLEASKKEAKELKEKLLAIEKIQHIVVELGLIVV